MSLYFVYFLSFQQVQSLFLATVVKAVTKCYMTIIKMLHSSMTYFNFVNKIFKNSEFETHNYVFVHVCMT